MLLKYRVNEDEKPPTIKATEKSTKACPAAQRVS
jgi:hypothetical protein